jgi:excinuclease ABC subunit A
LSTYSRLGGALLGAAKSGCADRGAPGGLNEAGRGMSELGIPLSDVVAEFMSGQALTNCLIFVVDRSNPVELAYSYHLPQIADRTAMEFLRIRGARTHNLKNINLDLPRNQLIVITGLSGSGKSSLAFDTLYAEGQRRYVESLSAYARQFLQLMEKPDVDLIEGLSPAISIEQKATSHNPRSTVGTVTEIHDYLRLLFARAGTPYCPEHNLPLEAQTVSQMVDSVLALPAETKLMILAPVVANRKGEQVDLFAELRAQGFARVRVNGTVYEIDDVPKLNKAQKHTVDVVVDRLKVRDDMRQRLAESFETALRHAEGRAIALEMDGGKEHMFSAKFACPVCSYALQELEPRLFSFNNPMGACPKCDGLGVIQFFDPKRVVVNPALSLAGGAIRGWDKKNQFYFQMLTSLATHFGFDVNAPYTSLPDDIKEMLLFGSGRVVLPFQYANERGQMMLREHVFEGIINNLERRYKESDSQAVRRGAQLLQLPATDRPQGAGRRQDPQGNHGTDFLPDQRRARLPVPGTLGRNTVWRRGAAHPARFADRLRADRRHVCAG